MNMCATLIRTLCACLALCGLCGVSGAHAGNLRPLEDEALSQVSGQDGLAFNLRGFAMSGPLTLTYTSPDEGNPSLWLGNFYLSRSDDVDATFSDPYRLNIYSRLGMSDVIELSNPLNVNGLVKWQFAADFGVNANNTSFSGGTLILQDLTFYGGGLSITTPSDPAVQGVAFGLALRVDIGNLIIRPRARDDISVANPDTVMEQLSIKGIHLSGENNTPWVIAHVTTQPGIFNAITDADGQSYLHLGIDWNSSPNGAPKGSLLIDNVTFKSDVTGNLNLGSSRIDSIQLQYLDVKFR
ncbi:MAG: hypothetical protein EPO09_10490 [Aquabacterium sp.]|uniref:hypothetical protein n=1 Tax=Aquabacterium sp. TaxID=1872578 RepID=UPI001203139E|nr:hypothetical protein [Aquabacterium sp.]TAK94122.1 MAG: hypothetical protein EPO09_10490 [Aquabacterium sp.]